MVKKLSELDDFEKSVLLLYQNDGHRGPGMVVKNLKKGLEKIGIKHYDIFHSNPTKYVGILQFCYPELLFQYPSSRKENVLVGPNLLVLPSDNPQICKSFENFITPSQWVKDLYLSFDLMKNKNIDVWPVGIDTEEWRPLLVEKDLDCLIYFKNRSEQDLKIAEAICRKNNLKYQVLKYGSYKEEELKNLCGRAKFAMLLTGTESQGVAYMQILSSNVPCYVFNNPEWKHESGKVSCKATSVPYWDDCCGKIAQNIDLKHFQEFLGLLGKNHFNPRKYILENHTLEKSALRYYNILRENDNAETVEL